MIWFTWFDFSCESCWLAISLVVLGWWRLLVWTWRASGLGVASGDNEKERRCWLKEEGW